MALKLGVHIEVIYWYSGPTKRASVERLWRDLLALSCWWLWNVVRLQVGALYSLWDSTAPLAATFDGDWLEVQRKACHGNTSVAAAMCCFSEQLLVSRKLFAFPNFTNKPKAYNQFFHHNAAAKLHGLFLPTCWGRPCTATALRCINVTDSRDTPPLIGCWGVITISNNDIDFKRSQEELKTRELTAIPF